MKYCLITGARGFFGHALVERVLATTDWTVVCPARPAKTPDRLQEIDQKGRVVSATSENIAVIIHAAANPSTLACIEDPGDAVHTNIVETFKILEFARTQQLEHFIFISSTGVYGNGGDELDRGYARNPYAASKIAGEQLCRAYFHSYGVPCSIARLGDVFGPRSQKERFPTLCIRKLLAGEPFLLHCDETGAVSAKNWVHSEDAADMVLFISRQPPGETYNVTGTESVSNLDLLTLLAKSVGTEFQYKIGAENIQGRILKIDAPPRLLYSLGWRPLATLEERVESFVRWTLEHPSWIS